MHIKKGALKAPNVNTNEKVIKQNIFLSRHYRQYIDRR